VRRPAGIVRTGVGKGLFSAEQLVWNIKVFAAAVNKAQPAGAKAIISTGL
jgi:ribosomal protein L1